MRQMALDTRVGTTSAYLSQARACGVGMHPCTFAGCADVVCKGCTPHTHTPPYPPNARVTEGDPRRCADVCADVVGVGSRGNSARMGPPGRLKASLGPTEEQAIATEFVSRGSRLSPLAHGSPHVAPGRVRRLRGGHGATWPTEGTEAKRGGLRRRRRCCAAERSFTHEANCQRDRRSAPPCRGDARVPVRTRRGRRHQATRVAGALRARGRATADRMEQAQRGGDPEAWTPLDARCRALPRDQRALPVGDLVAARSRPVRPHAQRRALRPGRPEAGGRTLQASTINGGNG